MMSKGENSMRIVFMGTPTFAVPSLQVCIEHHEVLAVVTQPDRPKGRGNKVIFSPVKEAALAATIPVLQPIKVKDPGFIEELTKLSPDLIVVVAFGQILPKQILEMTSLGCINVHGSLLPHYRGAAPIQWSIINGESVTGVTTMYMDVGIDTGDMILKKEIPIHKEDTYGTLQDKMSYSGAKVLRQTLQLILTKTAPREKQNHEEATYAPMLQKNTGHIRWNQTAEEIINLIRGLDPWPCAYTFYHGEMLKIWKAEVFEGSYEQGDFGQVLDVIKDKGIVVKTGTSNIILTELQAQGGRRMSGSDYLRGHTVDKNYVFE